GNGRGGGYNEVFRQTIAGSVGGGGYTCPTDIHIEGGINERGGNDHTGGTSQLGLVYFGAYKLLTYTDSLFSSPRPTTSLTAPSNPGDTVLNISSFSAFPASIGSGGTVVIDSDLVTFTGSTATTLTGCSGLTNAHVLGATVSWVANRSAITGRSDVTAGAPIGASLRFHNCSFQGDLGNNGVQGTGYIGLSMFDWPKGNGSAAPSLWFTGRNVFTTPGTVFLIDDTATDIHEQPGSIRLPGNVSATPGSAIVNLLVNAGGGTKTYDQLIRPSGLRVPTTQGTPTDALIGSVSVPITDGMVSVDNVNSLLYYRALGVHTRVARYSDLASLNGIFGTQGPYTSATTLVSKSATQVLTDTTG